MNEALTSNDDENNPSANIVHFGLIFQRELPVGTVIVDIPGMNGFDQVVKALKKILADKEHLDDKLLPAPEIKSRLQDEERERNFYGQTANYRAVIIPPNISIIPIGVRRRVKVEKATTFLAIRDRITTGIGNIGPITTECTVYLVSNPYFDPSKGVESRIPTEARVATKIREKHHIEELINNPHEEWAKQRAAALTAAYPARLPSLGKR